MTTTTRTDSPIPETEKKPVNLRGKFIADSVASCKEEPNLEGALLYNPDTDIITLVNSSGLIIWKYLNIPRSIAEISLFLQSQFFECPDPSVLHADIVETLQQLIPDFVHETE